ncbi:hypothetical protein OC846_004626 [Tilletia horrida]|uniref:Bromo domain-containing protein n=1 Tax=Tilletia horrida TaxID=155126 RepID=A0AAN6GQ48_9BASI|nr:hypothetical protein OC846_004626 [Tilletia horrida]KAK0563457.1 hypothetical protein OC861_004786 [Tilletia horrida]
MEGAAGFRVDDNDHVRVGAGSSALDSTSASALSKHVSGPSHAAAKPAIAPHHRLDSDEDEHEDEDDDDDADDDDFRIDDVQRDEQEDDGDQDEDEDDEDDEGEPTPSVSTPAGEDTPVLSKTQAAPVRRGRGTHLKPKPLHQVLDRVITALIRRDTYGFFSEPVDPQEVPGYLDVIKNPLDFGSIRKRVDEQQYKDVESFTADVHLVLQNAKTFNPPDSLYHTEAERLETWYEHKIGLEGPSAILPGSEARGNRPKGKGRESSLTVTQQGDEDDQDDDDSVMDDGTKRERGDRTASPEAGRPSNKKRKLNTEGGFDGRSLALAELISSGPVPVGVPSSSTTFGKAVVAASLARARWRLNAQAAAQSAGSAATDPVTPHQSSALLKNLLRQQSPTPDQASGPMSVPTAQATDEAVPSVNPLQALRKLQYHPDGSVKIPGFTTQAQGWPDTSDAFSMSLLPPSDQLYTMLGLPIPPPRIRALFPLLPLPAPPDAVVTANGRALPVPLSVGGTSGLNASTNLASASFAAAQQTPFTPAGNLFPNARNERAILKGGSLTSTLLPHPVPVSASFSHEVGSSANGAQSTFAPGQGTDGGPWTVPSEVDGLGPASDPSALRELVKAAESTKDIIAKGKWWDKTPEPATTKPARHWSIPGIVPYPTSTGAAGSAPVAYGGASASTGTSTPARGVPPGTPLGPGHALGQGPQSPSTQPSTPTGATNSPSAHGWAQRASKGRERERERESDVRDWTYTRPVLERAMTFWDVAGPLWTEVQAQMFRPASRLYQETIKEARARTAVLASEMTAAQGQARYGDVHRSAAQIHALNKTITEAQGALAQLEAWLSKDASRDRSRKLGRYDLVEGRRLQDALEYALKTEPADTLWTRFQKRVEIQKAEEGGGGQSTDAGSSLSKSDFESMLSTVQDGVWGGPVGEAYAYSIARFVQGAKKSVEEWSDLPTAHDSAEDGKDANGDEAGGAGEQQEEEYTYRGPAIKRDYNEEEYIGNGLRVLLVPPSEEIEGNDGLAEENGEGKQDVAETEGKTSVGFGPGHRKDPPATTTTTSRGDAETKSGSERGHDDDAPPPQPTHGRARYPTITRDARALDDIVRTDILGPLSGGMLDVLHLAGLSARETVEGLHHVTVNAQDVDVVQSF